MSLNALQRRIEVEIDHRAGDNAMGTDTPASSSIHGPRPPPGPPPQTDVGKGKKGGKGKGKGKLGNFAKGFAKGKGKGCNAFSTPYDQRQQMMAELSEMRDELRVMHAMHVAL